MSFIEVLIRLRERVELFIGLLCTYMGLGVWIGAIVFFGIGVAAPTFRFLPSKDLAGMLNGIMLQYLNSIEYGAWIILMIGITMVNRKVRAWYARVPFVLAASVLCCTLWYAQVISPRMHTLKSSITSFDTPQAQDAQSIAEFRGLHILYSRLVGVNLGLLVVLFVWQTGLLVATKTEKDS